MHHVCPATGHIVTAYPHGPTGSPPPYCPNHGVKVFSHCRECDKPWDVVAKGYSMRPTQGVSFCRYCGTPAPWLTRADLMAWVRHQVQASEDITSAARVELMAVLDRLQDMDPSDDKAVPVWKRLHELAPAVYNSTKPVRDALMSESVKRILEGLFGSG